LLNPFADVSACEFVTAGVAGELIGTGGIAAASGGAAGVAAGGLLVLTGIGIYVTGELGCEEG
jgi:hypothetical protein